MTDLELLLLLFMIFTPWAIISTVITVFFFILAKKSQALTLIWHKFTNKLLILKISATSQVNLVLCKEIRNFLQISKNEYIMLPASSSSNPSGTLKEYVRERGILNGKPVYFVQEGKAIAVTPKLLKLLNMAEKDPKNIRIKEGEVLGYDVIKSFFSKMYQPSIIRAISLESEEIGRQEAGFGLGRFALPLGIFTGLAILLFVMYIILKSMGVL